MNSDQEGNRAELHGTITRLQPPHLLEWESDSHGVLRWELREERSGTALTLTVTVDVDDDELGLALAGWHIHLEHLADALDGRPVDWSRWHTVHLPRWKRLHAGYAARV